MFIAFLRIGPVVERGRESPKERKGEERVAESREAEGESDGRKRGGGRIGSRRGGWKGKQNWVRMRPEKTRSMVPPCHVTMEAENT